MKISLLKKSGLLALFLLAVFSSFAQIRLAGFFGDHMVLQQQRPIRIWGTTLPGEWVRVSMEGRVTVATADEEGKWVATFGAVAAGGPYELKMQTPSDTMTLSDVWVGEVWFCLGQSNMEWPLRRAANGATEIAAAALPQIRYFKVPHRMAMQPTDDLPFNSWTICQPETAPNYSAVAYFFAKHINQEQNVPVGLIEASWGGTTIASWMSADALANHPKFGTQVANMAHLNLGDLQDSIARATTDWLGAIETTDIGLQENWQTEAIDWRSWPTMLLPQPWETGGPINVDGAVWFKTAFELESKQTKANISLSLGVLQRLATVAKQLVFEQQTNFSGPELERVEILDQEIRLTFQGVGEGLRPINGQEDLRGFAIAGEDGRFQWARAELLNATQVRVYHPAILAPRYIRYAWSDNPGPLNLYNMDGLPAAPFRTDKFKLPWE